MIEPDVGKDGEHGRVEGVVVKPFGELERRARVTLGPGAPLCVRSRVRESCVNGRLECAVAGGLGQGLEEQRHGHPRCLELRIEDESLGVPRTMWRCREEIARDGARTGALARLQVCASGRQGATLPIVGCVLWRQPKGVFGKLGRGDRHAATPRDDRRRLEGPGKVAVGRLGSKGEVPGAFDRVREDRGQEPVGGDALVWRHAVVRAGRQQRVGEAHDAIGLLDHVDGHGSPERARRDLERAEEIGGQAPVCGDQKQSSPRRRVEGSKPFLDGPLEAGRDRQRNCRVPCRVGRSGAGELEGVERVATRSLVELQQRRPRQRDSKPLPQETLEGPDAQRTDAQSLDIGRVDRVFERGRRRSVEPPGEEQQDRLQRQASQCEPDRARPKSDPSIDRRRSRARAAGHQRGSAGSWRSRHRAPGDRPRGGPGLLEAGARIRTRGASGPAASPGARAGCRRTGRRGQGSGAFVRSRLAAT